MARFGQSEIQEVRTRADIIEIIGAHVRLKRSGRSFSGLCPFHNEKTPSFSVSPERGFFHCFGCGVGGTVFDFVMRIEGLTFPEALQTLARRYGVTLSAPESGPLADPSGTGGAQRAGFAEANQLAADFYAHVLWNTGDGELAREYLKSRGISVETARAFMLGFAPHRPANLAGILQRRGLLEAALRLGLARRDDSGTVQDMFRARLMFPIRDPRGTVIAFGGRVLDNRLPKYINSAESPLYSKAGALYGLYEGRQTISKIDRAIVVEGYIDVIALSQGGFKETVASLGTSLTVEQLRLLSRYTRNVIACFDGDAAGHKASLRALEVFLQAGLLGRSVFMPPGHDPDTLIHERGAEHFNQLLQGSELLVEMFLREQASVAPKDRAALDERARVLASVAEKLRLIKDEFQFNLLVRRAVDLVRFTEREEAMLRKEGRRQSARSRVSAREESRTKEQAASFDRAPSLDAIAQAELGLIALGLRYPELRPQLRSRIGPLELHDRVLGSLLEEICAAGESLPSLEVAIMSRLNEPQRGWLSGMMVGPLMDEDRRAPLMDDYLNALAEAQRRREVAQLRNTALTSQGDQAIVAAQGIILARRRATHRDDAR